MTKKISIALAFSLLLGGAGMFVVTRLTGSAPPPQTPSTVEASLSPRHIILTPEAIQNAQLAIETAGPARMQSIIDIPGKVGINMDAMAHIVPRLEGIVREVHKNIGERADSGDILAVLESRELADAKLQYLTATKHQELARVELQRETIISEHTTRMLDLLVQGTDLDALQSKLKDAIIGESRAQLIPAYAKVQFAKTTYLREKGLFKKKISTESDYLLALEAYKSAQAIYTSLLESTSYHAHLALLQKQKAVQLAELDLQTATAKLMTLGLSSSEVRSLVTSTEQALTRYVLKAPIHGTIIRKKIAIGEAVKENTDVFVLADMQSVWIDAVVQARDAKQLKVGRSVMVTVKDGDLEQTGKLTYISPLVDEQTQTVMARVVLQNPAGDWRPGLFVTAKLVLHEVTVPLAVSAEAVHLMGEDSVVFVQAEEGIVARPVQLGWSDGRFIEVLKGLAPGERYAGKNSFVLKAEWLNQEGA